jgi:hypothetical protein
MDVWDAGRSDEAAAGHAALEQTHAEAMAMLRGAGRSASPWLVVVEAPDGEGIRVCVGGEAAGGPEKFVWGALQALAQIAAGIDLDARHAVEDALGD